MTRIWKAGSPPSALPGIDSPLSGIYHEAMGRVRRDIDIEGRSIWTLFDTGSRNTYIVESALNGLQTKNLREPKSVALGGKKHQFDRACTFEALVDGKRVVGIAFILDRIGKDEDGREIELIFGAILMQNWGIRVCPDTESLDLSNYPEEFVEFSSVT